MPPISRNFTRESKIWTHEDKTANGKGKVGLIACALLIIFAGFFTMFVMGILGTKGIVPMAPGGAYALIVLGVLPLVPCAVVGCKSAWKDR